MKKIIFVFLLLLLSTSICVADEDMIRKAYSYYNRGMMVEAIEIMKEASAEDPTPGQLYFIGYAYYKLQDFKNARKYFDKAYNINKEHNPMKGSKME